MKLKISIVIPTLNEEKFLPHILESIKKQSMSPEEIIVADGPSTDKTKEVARSFGCKVIDGGNHPGEGRNNGAKIATQPILLFLDADGYLSSDFLEKNISEFEKRKLDIATCYVITDSKHAIDKIGAHFINFYYKVSQKFLPHVYGNYIFSRKSIHQKIGGFNEGFYLGEDQDYVLRAVKNGAKYGILNSEKGVTSLRRHRKDGRLKTVLTYTYVEFHTIFSGGIKNKVFNYVFGKH